MDSSRRSPGRRRSTLLPQQLASVQSSGKAGGALFINQHETGSFPGFLDAWLAGYGMPAHLSYAALSDGGVIAANKQSYGVAWPSLDFTAAKLIVSFGADFLETWGASVPQQLSFADARAKGADAPRVIYIGPRRSLTGMNADQWIACKPGSELAIANALAGTGSIAQAATAADVPAAMLQGLATALARGAEPVARGRGMELALAVNALNQKYGNVGRSVLTAKPIESFEGMSSDAELTDAIEQHARGAGAGALRARREPRVHAAEEREGCRRDGQGRSSRFRSRAIPTRRPSCAISCSRTTTRSSRGAMRSRSPA